MKAQNTENLERLVSVRVFGSVARGDADLKSDLDILAVVLGDKKPPEEVLKGLIVKRFGKEGSITWYSYNRMRALFQQGHLFAWHVFLESKQIMPLGESDAMRCLGKPSTYTNATKDMTVLIELLSSVRNAIKKTPRNLVYEAGLIYVCAKNIALIASSFRNGHLDFSRYSPYHVKIDSLEFPVPQGDYNLLIEARHASMRGFESPKLCADEIMRLQAEVVEWSKMARAHCQEA